MKIRILTQESFNNWPENKAGSSRIRGRWLAKYWPEASEYIIGEKPDVMIFQKAYWKEMMRDLDCIKIFDICDPDWKDGLNIVEVMSYMHGCVTSTEALAQEIRKYTDKPVICIPDRFDLSLFKNPKPNHNAEISTAGWYGYSHNFEVMIPAIPFFKQRNIKVVAISDKAIMDAHEWIQYDFSTIHEYIKQFDVMVLPDGPSRHFKSNNKIIESQLCGVPVVRNVDDLDRLSSQEARENEAKLKYDEAVRDYDVNLSVAEYKQFIDRLTNDTK